MKILLLPSYFEPEQFASLHLGNHRCQAFVESGYDVLVYTPMPTRGVTVDVRESYRRNKRRERGKKKKGGKTALSFCLKNTSI